MSPPGDDPQPAPERAAEGVETETLDPQDLSTLEALEEAGDVETLLTLAAAYESGTDEIEADPARLETELALIAQKLDVDEELDRLQSHISEIRSVLQKQEPVGRKLDFLMQELNREANTLGSKSADTETTSAAVELKVLIEQMREQIQNVE